MANSLGGSTRHIEGITILRALEDGSVVVQLSPSAIKALEQIAAAAAPTIKAKLYANELKRGEATRERLDQDMREVKNKLLEDLREPNAARLAAIKRGPLDWNNQ